MQQAIEEQSEPKVFSAMKRFSELLALFVASKGGYLSTSLYSFGQSKEKYTLNLVKNSQSVKFRWLILGREHYFETSKEYPIANKSDLLQALKFDDSNAPFKGITLHHIERISEQSHKVTFWVFNEKVIDQLAIRPWVILPESFVLGKALPKGVSNATIEGVGKTLFIAKAGQSIVSGVKSQQVPSIESFASSSGCALQQTSDKFLQSNSEEFLPLLKLGVKSLSIANLQGFRLKPKPVNWQKYPWQQAAFISLGALVVYLALTSGWLFLRNNLIDHELISQTDDVNQALSIQKQYQLELSKHEQLLAPLKDKEPYWQIWPIIIEVANLGTKIRSAQYQNNQIILQGTTNKNVKATDVLVLLTKLPTVATPSFAKPVRKRGTSEEFNISFSFKRTEIKETDKVATLSAQGGNDAARK